MELGAGLHQADRTRINPLPDATMDRDSQKAAGAACQLSRAAGERQENPMPSTHLGPIGVSEQLLLLLLLYLLPTAYGKREFIQVVGGRDKCAPRWDHQALGLNDPTATDQRARLQGYGRKNCGR